MNVFILTLTNKLLTLIWIIVCKSNKINSRMKVMIQYRQNTGISMSLLANNHVFTGDFFLNKL